MGKTITTHLLEGTPKGISSIQISNRTIIAYLIPRSELKKCSDLSELQTPCMYILFGETEDGSPKAYIGETDNFLDRVAEHNRKKDFWQKALVFTSMASQLNKADIMYLEYIALKEAIHLSHFDLSENKQIPKIPTLQRHALDTITDFFNDVKFITEFANYDIFKRIEKEAQLLFYTTGRKSDARGIYNENGFTVLKGSIVATTVVNSYSRSEKREALLTKHAETIANKLVLKNDMVFNSPSTAADFCIGSSNNGWIVWKTKEGKTLDEVYRK